jgi:hypothetical protein
MAKTRDQLAERALSRLGKAGEGMDIIAGDKKLVMDQIDGMFASLAARNVFSSSNPAVIDEATFQELSAILANMVADDFSLSADEIQIINQRASNGEDRLRQMQRIVQNSRVARATYF